MRYDTLTVTLTGAVISSATAIQITPSLCQKKTGSAWVTASGAVSGVMTYSWSNSSTSEFITVNSSGNYIVTVTNNNGCTGTASQSVTVNPLPIPTITPIGNTVFCQGDSVTLDAGIYSSYAWSNSATNETIVDYASGNFIVTVTDNNGCTGITSQSITVNSLPTPTITPNGNTIFCQGDSVSLDAGLYSSYSWNNSATDETIVADSSGNYIVTVTDINGCTGTGSQLVTVNQLPIVSFSGLPDTVCITSGDQILTGNPTGGTFIGNGMTGNTFNPSTLSQGIDTITYSYSDANGCNNTAIHTVNVQICTGIPIGNNNNNLSVYPNPATGMVTISFDAKGNDNYTIRLFDMPGRIVLEDAFESTKGNNKHDFSLDNIAKGIYIIELRTGDSFNKVKLIIQ